MGALVPGPRGKTEHRLKSLVPITIKLWNGLGDDAQFDQSLQSFKKMAAGHLRNSAAILADASADRRKTEEIDTESERTQLSV